MNKDFSYFVHPKSGHESMLFALGLLLAVLLPLSRLGALFMLPGGLTNRLSKRH